MHPARLLDMLAVAEKAAIASANWIGRGDKTAADQAATTAMRDAFNDLDICGRIVIGEGERDEAPMLFIGEELGLGGEELDIAVDPLEGTNLCAFGKPNALTTVAVAPRGTLLYAPDTYMDKIAAGPACTGVVGIDKAPAENVAAVARTLGKPVEDANLEEVQARYRTPYFIWANAAARGKYGDKLTRIEDADVTSLNYLSSLLLDATGLPRDSRALYRSALRQALPAVNLNGYRDAEGTWHWFGEAVETDAQKTAEDALKSYAIVQYDQLFKDRSNR